MIRVGRQPTLEAESVSRDENALSKYGCRWPPNGCESEGGLASVEMLRLQPSLARHDFTFVKPKRDPHGMR